MQEVNTEKFKIGRADRGTSNVPWVGKHYCTLRVETQTYSAPCRRTSLVPHTAVGMAVYSVVPPGKGPHDVHEHLAHKTEHLVRPVCKHPVHFTTVTLNIWLGNIRCQIRPSGISCQGLKHLNFFLLVNKL